MSRVYIKQYTVCFDNEDTVKELHAIGFIRYRSLVLNVLFLEPYGMSEAEISKIKGVTHVKENLIRLYSNKKT